MAKIIRQQRMDYGGVRVWCEGDDQPVYLADGRIDQKRIDAVLAGRAASAVEAQKIRRIDEVLEGELERRKGDVGDLYDKSEEEAITAVFFGIASIPIKAK